MPHPRLRQVALFVALVASAGCASTQHTSDVNKASKIIPPEQLRGSQPPAINGPVDLRIEVLISADGEPDMRTLKVTGKGAGSGRPAIEDWIRNSTFKPAMQDGHPVAATLRIGLKSETRQVRM